MRKKYLLPKKKRFVCMYEDCRKIARPGFIYCEQHIPKELDALQIKPGFSLHGILVTIHKLFDRKKRSINIETIGNNYDWTVKVHDQINNDKYYYDKKCKTCCNQSIDGFKKYGGGVCSGNYLGHCPHCKGYCYDKKCYLYVTGGIHKISSHGKMKN